MPQDTSPVNRLKYKQFAPEAPRLTTVQEVQRIMSGVPERRRKHIITRLGIVRDRLAQPGVWIRGDWARCAYSGAPCDPTEPSAGQFSLSGAINSFLPHEQPRFGKAKQYPEVSAMHSLVALALYEREKKRRDRPDRPSRFAIHYFNDFMANGLDDVLALVDEAMALAKMGAHD